MCFHLQPKLLLPKTYFSSPGQTRTVDRLFVRQLPSPLGHRTMYFNQAEDQGLEPRSAFDASRVQNGFLIQSDVFQREGVIDRN